MEYSVNLYSGLWFAVWVCKLGSQSRQMVCWMGLQGRFAAWAHGMQSEQCRSQIQAQGTQRQMHQTSPRYAPDKHTVCTRQAHGMHQTSTRYATDKHKVCTRQAQGMLLALHTLCLSGAYLGAASETYIWRCICSAKCTRTRSC